MKYIVIILVLLALCGSAFTQGSFTVPHWIGLGDFIYNKNADSVGIIIGTDTTWFTTNIIRRGLDTVSELGPAIEGDELGTGLIDSITAAYDSSQVGYLNPADANVDTAAWNAGGAGEANTLSDTGTFNGTEGFGLAGGKTGTALKVKGLIEGSNVTIAASGDSAYTIAATGGGAGGWTDDGDVVRLTTVGDTVGIGTATPKAKLHVEGGAIIDGDIDSVDDISGKGGGSVMSITSDTWIWAGYNRGYGTRFFGGAGETSPSLQIGISGGNDTIIFTTDLTLTGANIVMSGTEMVDGVDISAISIADSIGDSLPNYFDTAAVVDTIQGVLTEGGYLTNSKFSDSSITLLNATAWRLFYSNATTTAIQELALGSDGTYLKSNGASSAPTWATPGGAGGWTDDGNYVRLTNVNDSVGIGTATPEEKLHITGNSATLMLEDDSGNKGGLSVGNSQICLEIDPDNLITSSDICFDIDGSEIARFHQSTNFGIGTLSPPERISVVGNIATGDTTTGDVDVWHYFSTDGSWTTEYLKWDDGNAQFEISDDLNVAGTISSSDTLTSSFVIITPAAANDFPFWQTRKAITITAVSAVCTGGTNVIGALQEYNATGTSVDAAVDGDWTITTSEYTDVSFTNAGIDAGDWLGWKTTSVSGSVVTFSITFEYTVD